MKNRLYRDLNSYLKDCFSKRVYKITLDAGLTCPNRERGEECIYCNSRGSGTGLFRQGISLEEQIKKGMDGIRRKYKNVDAFIAYFQSYTNTYAPIEQLARIWGVVKSFSEIVAISVGTRPDCVDKERLELLNSFGDNYKIFLELGLQSIKDENFRWMRRGHGLKEFEEAVKLAERYPFDIVAHVIFGFPEDTTKDAIAMANYLSTLPVKGVKLHLLYVSKNAPLFKLYEQGMYQPISRELYIDMVVNFISHLRPDMVIHRLTGDAHKGELVAPLWSAEKTSVIEEIRRRLISEGLYQGKEFLAC